MKNKFSELTVVPIPPKDGLVGFVNVVFDNAFYLSGIGIFTRPQGGFRLTYPIRNNMNVFRPINKEIGQALEDLVTEKISELLMKNFEFKDDQ